MTFTGYTGPDPICGPLLNELHKITTEYSSNEAKLAAADGDRNKALEAFMESSDNPQAVKLRQTVEKARQALKDLAEKNVESITLSDVEKEKIRTLLSGLKGRIRSAHDAIKGAVETLGTDPEGVRAALESIGDPSRTGRGRAKGSKGSGLPRASVLVTVDGGKINKVEYDSFSKVALALTAEVKDLQLAYAHSAGVDPSDIKTVKKPVEFSFKTNDGTEYKLSTRPKPRAKPGPTPKSESNSEGQEEAA